MSKGSAIVAICIAFVAGVLIGHLFTGGNAGDQLAANGEVAPEGAAGAVAAAPADGVERFRVPVTSEQPQKGPADALVTIVEFSDFECPFCSRVGPTLSRIMNEYAGKVRVVWRNQPLPFHQNAMPAHTLAMEAFAQGGSEKFFRVHDLLFENQRALSRADLERYAQQAGLDMNRVRAALDNNTHKAKIEADQQLANEIGARGTPHFFINGRKLAGAQPYEEFKKVIDEEIAGAERLVRGGTAKAQVYGALMQNALAKAAPAQPAAAQPQEARRMPDPNAVYKVPVGDQPIKGSPTALVTIVEVSDFECPFCSRVGPTLQQIASTYGNDVRVAWLNNPLPFHQNAMPAHTAAMEVFRQGGNDKFWAYHDKLFQNQRELTRENLEKWATELGGINIAQFRQALDTERHKGAIERDQQLARSVGATGTPSFFINGRNLRGAQPFEAFKAMIDEELTKARALVQRGTPRNRVYEETIKNGATEPQFLAPSGDEGGGANPEADRVYTLAVPANAPSKGGANAKVVIQEFSDFQCPFCSRVNPTMKQIMDEYGNRVRVVWRNYPLPFHQDAHLAAQASLEAFRQGGDAKFWAYHDKLFENQRALSRADLERYAEEIGGINMGQFRQALDSERHKAAVDADMAAVRTAGAQIGTPSFFINGRLLQGAQPFDAFKAAIDRALAEAR